MRVMRYYVNQITVARCGFSLHLHDSESGHRLNDNTLQGIRYRRFSDEFMCFSVQQMLCVLESLGKNPIATYLG